MPDLRGLFLRGYGGKSAALGTTQDQATASSGIQIATAFIDLGGGGWDGWAYAPYPQAGGSWTTLPGTGDDALRVPPGFLVKVRVTRRSNTNNLTVADPEPGPSIR